MEKSCVPFVAPPLSPFKGSVRYDVLDKTEGTIYDYKFGKAGLSDSRRSQLLKHAPAGVNKAKEVRPCPN